LGSFRNFAFLTQSLAHKQRPHVKRGKRKGRHFCNTDSACTARGSAPEHAAPRELSQHPPSPKLRRGKSPYVKEQRLPHFTRQTWGILPWVPVKKKGSDYRYFFELRPQQSPYSACLILVSGHFSVRLLNLKFACIARTAIGH
jgi:hypothetical protein